ncbi:MAG: type ISP restriction/modification enzyme [Limisphaerales bacterium]
MHPLESYLGELREIHDCGAATKETSGYPVLCKLLDAIGQTLKPKVRCIIQLRNSGAGLPDGGPFTPDQLKQTESEVPLFGLAPARGVIEVKSTSEELASVAKSQQIKEYLAHYGQLLLTNYRDFLLLKGLPGDEPQCLESFHLADNEAAFWVAAAHPRRTADALGERLSEYLKRVFLHAAPLNTPRDVAFFLGSYARDARSRVEHAGDLPALAAVRLALEEAVGMRFEAEKGEHFFRSTLVQTIFYGVFSAWVLWHKERAFRTDAFDWKAAAWTLHVPTIKALFEQVATPTKLGPLGLVEVLDWTATALNRVNRRVFFDNFVESRAVQYFYEPFLEAFDPALRKELGVWYTPPEIVQYQVARVDNVLREELEIPDGLADPRVFVLDPCCGTGAYLVEVLRTIVHTLREEKGEGALAEFAAKEAIQKRVFGFEIMPAPFVVAHLQMGLLLQSLGVPFDDRKDERAGIFLTNSLTGWDFKGQDKHLANWPELEAERAGAGRVKQDKPILVILGNPPYNAFAGVSPEEEHGLVEVYKGAYEAEQVRGGRTAPKEGSALKKVRRYRLSDPLSAGGWGIKKFNLDDLYVRFFRLAERRIAEKTGKGIVCFISNFSYLGDPSFVVMRERFLAEFDTLWFDCLNGDSRETGKLTPHGRPDPSVFSTEYNREGIRVGTAVSLMVRRPGRADKPRVLFRHFWGANKRADILASLAAERFGRQYSAAHPTRDNRFSFLPLRVSKEYFGWPKVVALCQRPPISGLQEMRHGALLDIDREKLAKRMAAYLDPELDWDTLKALGSGLTKTAGGFGPQEARKKALGLERYRSENLRRYALYPFDNRWCYYTAIPTLWNRPRPDLAAHCWRGNRFFVTRMFAERPHERMAMTMTPELPDYHLLRPNAVAIPLCLRPAPASRAGKAREDGNGEFGSLLQEAAGAYGAHGDGIRANLSAEARAYLATLGILKPDDDAETASLVWMHALAIGFSPAYLTENADGIRQDWPRVPLPGSRALLLASAAMGEQVAALLDMEAAVDGVTGSKLRAELGAIAVLSSAADLALTAGWGHAGKEGVTMPGKGKILTRAYRPGEEPERRLRDLLGRSTHDVYLNDTACWRNVPEKVWDFTIGGYPVIKKWLSYREYALLGRALTPDEAREVTHIARRLTALLILAPALDANYAAVRSSTGAAR